MRRRMDDLLRAEPVLDGHHRRSGQMACEGRRDLVDMRRLGRDDAQVGIAELARVGGRVQVRREVVAAGDTQPLLA